MFTVKVQYDEVRGTLVKLQTELNTLRSQTNRASRAKSDLLAESVRIISFSLDLRYIACEFLSFLSGTVRELCYQISELNYSEIR